MKKILLTILLLSPFIPNLANAYPPDNAAVIYYKLMGFQEDPAEAIWDMVADASTSTEPISEEVKAFVDKYKKNFTIQELEIASELNHCDWGLDVSQGFALQFPRIGKMKRFTYLLLADGAIAASQGDISTALDKNLVVRRMAHHMTNETVIGFLVSLSMNRKCDEALSHILSTYPMHEKTLVELKNELLWETYRPKSIRHPFMLEKEVCLQEISIMTPERYTEVLQGGSGNKDTDKRVMEYLKDIDPEARKRSAAIFSNYYDGIFAVLEKPYKQAYEKICAISKKMGNDAEDNDDALLPAIFCPALSKCYSLGTGWKTNYDAMLTALDVYIAAAKTGKLPEELPKSTYIDHFSGKPFIYEVTDDGFTLKCQQEDLSKKEVHEFHYKLPK